MGKEQDEDVDKKVTKAVSEVGYSVMGQAKATSILP